VERARARQEAQQWSADLVKNESDEEREHRKARKAANRKVKSEATSGDEGISTPAGGAGGNDGEPKKKRRKLKKSGGVASAAASTQPSDAEDGGLFSEGEEEKPLKKVRFFFLGIFLVVLCLWSARQPSVEQRESVLHEKRTTNRPLHRVKSNSKSLLYA
jgi:hypothetical protein